MVILVEINLAGKNKKTKGTERPVLFPQYLKNV
jgi:hypothetical protein